MGTAAAMPVGLKAHLVVVSSIPRTIAGDRRPLGELLLLLHLFLLLIYCISELGQVRNDEEAMKCECCISFFIDGVVIGLSEFYDPCITICIDSASCRIVGFQVCIQVEIRQ